jgi:hypothetical protein
LNTDLELVNASVLVNPDVSVMSNSHRVNISLKATNINT